MLQEATSIQSRKSALRVHMRAVRSAMTIEERAAASSAVCARLMGVNRAGTFNRIAVYLAQPEEANIDAFSAWLIARGVTVAAPRTQDGTPAPFYPLLDMQSVVRNGRLGVREPRHNPDGLSYRAEDFDVILAPGLAFDAGGGRLGFGGGWYDRALQTGVLQARVLILGVCFDCQIVDQVPREDHDIAMAAVVTEKRIMDADGRLAALLGGITDRL